MLKNCNKADLKVIATELGLSFDKKATIVQLIALIEKCNHFKTNLELVESVINSTIEERKHSQEIELEKAKAEQNQITLEQIRLERTKAEVELARLRSEINSANISENLSENQKNESLESLDSLVKSIRTLTVKFPINKPEAFSYFFSSLERAFVSKNVPEKFKAEILLNLLGDKASNVITYIKDDELSDYSKIKAIVLREFEPSPQICLENFRKTQRQTGETYMQFASRLTTSWDYYLKVRNVSEFETLKKLVVSDKICQTLDKEVMCFINVRQNNSWFEPIELAKEIDLFYNSKGKPVIDSKPSNKNNYPKHVSKVFLADVKNSKCILSCNEMHALYKCPIFKTMSVSDRVELVKSNSLCFNCLSKGCKANNCRSKFSCAVCKKKHNTVLHFPRDQIISKEVIQRNEAESIHSTLDASAPAFEPGNNLFQTSCNFASDLKTVLLSTFVCLLKDDSGECFYCRGILDVGANNNFVTKRLVDKLQLKGERINISVSGINNLSLNVKSRVSATVLNKDKSFESNMSFLVVPKLTEFTPAKPLEIDVSSLSNIKLADDKFFEPGAIDILIGAEYFYDLLKPGQICLKDTNLKLQNSVFGYIVSGSLLVKGGANIHCGLITDNLELERTLRDFWEIENVERESEISKTKEAEICEEHFLKNHSRTETGKYMVKMPLKEDPSCLGESKKRAEKCLNSLWIRLGREPKFRELYKSFMQEYLSMGHMEEVIESEEPDVKYYIPHHCVFRPESNSTPLRVVFNASALTSSGKSLNSIQFNGGTIQDDLLSIMLRFRKHQFAFVADIKKMYRMILIDPNQRDLLRILFKAELNDPVKVYKLCTVTYGTTSAPFLATRSVQQLAKDEGKDFPLASSVLLQDVYMDDVVTGCNSLSEAQDIQQQLISLLDRGGMELHKWSANNPSLLCDKMIDSDYAFTNDTKTLGILWKPQTDCFGFNLIIEKSEVYTKRAVLSQIARIFDPLGLLGPIITRAKVFLQKLWSLNLDWCDSLPSKENAEWQSFLTSLESVNLIRVPRWLLSEDSIRVELHGFCDSSKLAYGAAIYVKSLNSQGDCEVKLLTSKSRVAPLKCVTIPRLELCAAVLLARLVTKVSSALKLDVSNTYLWCDSMIVLCWLQKEPCHLKTFVANRVSEIQKLTKISQWRHVASHENPADLISRGVVPDRLSESSLWWKGPEFLNGDCYPEKDIPSTPVIQTDVSVELKKSKPMCLTLSATEKENFMDCLFVIKNNYLKLIRVVSFIFRFLFNVRNPTAKRSGPLTGNELQVASEFLIKEAQVREFEEEIKNLKKGVSVPKNSKVKSLNCFLDESSILRVGGRLKYSDLSLDEKHPIVLPDKHPLTLSIVRYYHIKYLHVGSNALLYHIRRKFWIVNGRSVCRKVVFQCVTCFKTKPVLESQIMGDLPKERVTTSFPFSNVGIDFCGPFYIKFKNQRKGVLNKVYVCIFVCLSTKAIHLDFVTDLTSDAFIACLKRFFSRRGKSSKIFSDNAKNFVGASVELKKLQKLVSHPEETLANFLSSENINWKFIPPKSPNFGGLWEAGVKSFKYHLKRVIGNANLTLEEFLTVILEIESVLNSRPLTPLSTEFDNFETLSPGHFLIGRPLNSVIEPDLFNIAENRLSKWQKIKKYSERIWKLWKKDYLNTLQQRCKWMFAKNNVKLGSLVLIKDENMPSVKWFTGRISEIFVGKDAKVRVVNVLLPTGKILKRNVRDICVLPISD